MKTTPGPWIIRDNSTDFAIRCTVEKIDNGLRSVICQSDETWLCPEHGGTGVESNARLIAAAPDLLEACKLAHDIISAHSRLHEPNYTENIMPAIALIEQAIEKAT